MERKKGVVAAAVVPISKMTNTYLTTICKITGAAKGQVLDKLIENAANLVIAPVYLINKHYYDTQVCIAALDRISQYGHDPLKPRKLNSGRKSYLTKEENMALKKLKESARVLEQTELISEEIQKQMVSLGVLKL